MMSSGTLGAALEASIDGVRSIAASLAYAESYSVDELDLDNAFKSAARITIDTIKKLEQYQFPEEIDALNLNVPYNLKEDTLVVCKPSRGSYGRIYDREKADYPFKKRRDFELVNVEPDDSRNADSYYLKNGQPTITPVSLEITSSQGMEKLQRALGSGYRNLIVVS